jgi:peptidyl-prolyl cis-trans isomerase A (cyclophilin A)
MRQGLAQPMPCFYDELAQSDRSNIGSNLEFSNAEGAGTHLPETMCEGPHEPNFAGGLMRAKGDGGKFRVSAFALGALIASGCVFHAPRPLAEDDLDPELARLVGPVVNAQEDDATGASRRLTFKKGDQPRVGMEIDEIQAYNKAQGDPVDGFFALETALTGLAGEGDLSVEFHTTQGIMRCTLFTRQAPITVASFVGLARGIRPFLDSASQEWVTKPFFDETIFHRIIPDFMIQGGDREGSGAGGPGFVLPDEIDDLIRFDRPGRLAMANRGLTTGGGQFFVTLGETPHLDGRHTIFGQCDDEGVRVAKKIAAVERDASDRPKEPQSIQRLVFSR